jgi:hypothetical protein
MGGCWHCNQEVFEARDPKGGRSGIFFLLLEKSCPSVCPTMGCTQHAGVVRWMSSITLCLERMHAGVAIARKGRR